MDGKLAKEKKIKQKIVNSIICFICENMQESCSGWSISKGKQQYFGFYHCTFSDDSRRGVCPINTYIHTLAKALQSQSQNSTPSLELLLLFMLQPCEV